MGATWSEMVVEVLGAVAEVVGGVVEVLDAVVDGDDDEHPATSAASADANVTSSLGAAGAGRRRVVEGCRVTGIPRRSIVRTVRRRVRPRPHAGA